MTSVAAKACKREKIKDVIFVTAGQAQADAKEMAVRMLLMVRWVLFMMKMVT